MADVFPIASEEFIYDIELTGTYDTPLLPYVISEGFVYPVGYQGNFDTAIFPGLVQSEEYLFFPTTGEPIVLAYPELISSGEVIYPAAANHFDVYVDAFTDEEYFPASATSDITVSADTIDGWVVYPASATSVLDIMVTMVPSAETVYPVEVETFNVITTTSYIPSEEYVYPVTLVLSDNLPLLINKAKNNGEFSTVNISPYQRYYPSVAHPITSGDVRVARSASVLSRYIPSEDAVFLGTYYDAFYIYNGFTSEPVVRDNIYLSISGGRQFNLTNIHGSVTISEPHLVMPSLDQNRALTASTRSTTLGQLNISLFPSPEGNLVEFNRDGSSKYLDLRNQDFIPSTRRVRIPRLEPGEYYGVYVKVEARFSPDVPTPTDYAFLNLSYVNDYYSPTLPNLRDIYPGQTTTMTNDPRAQWLPSIYFEFNTGYTAVLDEIDTTVDGLYSKYPPYFLHKDDL